MSRWIRDELMEFVLSNVEVLGEERVLGTGSYGSVREVKVNGEVCAAKMIHEVLLETDERGGVESVVAKYQRECRLMSRMRHPNITQFIGLCFLDGSRLPLLVMERLECSLDELVETTPNLPFSVSVYMLTGVCRGLLYLHRESVVHRDLTARNVLLSTSLKAKITDFGNSRIVQMDPSQLVRTLTRYPGTLVYMSPEAVSERGQYGPSLDVFSFGVLTLFVLTQMFPGELLSPNYPDPTHPDRLLGRSEFERRSVYTSHLEMSLPGGQEHPLFGVVRDCLANNPERRLTTSVLLSSLEEVGTETEGGLLQLDITRVKTVRSLRAKDQRIAQLERELTEKDNLLKHKDDLVTEKDGLLIRQQETFQGDLSAKDAVIDRKNRELSQKDDVLTQNARQLAVKDEVIAEQQSTITEKERTLAKMEALIQAHREQIELKDAELARRAALIQQLDRTEMTRDHVIEKKGSVTSVKEAANPGDSQQNLRPPLTLKWRRGKDMPIKMGGAVQCVVIGDRVYVGGGGTDNDTDTCTVMKLDLQQDEWTKLPQYSTKWFAMTSHDNQLVLVGGCELGTIKRSRQITVYRTGEWTHPYPPMNVARSHSTAVSFTNKIIVAGGKDDQHHTGTSSVELLDVTSRRWYTAKSLPNPRYYIKPTLIEDTLYLMGGFDVSGLKTKVVYKVDLNELITEAVSKQATQTLWQVIEDTPLMLSAPLNVRGSLLAVGGRDDSHKPSSSIHLYQPDTGRWVKVGDLPIARLGCTCSVLTNGEVIVAGGSDGPFLWNCLNTVDFLTITDSH